MKNTTIGAAITRSRARRRKACAATLCAVAGTLVVGVAPAAANVECGAVITVSTTLTHDLENCPATAITMNGSNIVFDLGGHTIDGQGVGVGVRSDRDGNTIRNGKVQQFQVGVHIHFQRSGVTITGVTATENIRGINLDAGANNNRVVGNIAAGNETGIDLATDSHGNQVTSNQATGNSTYGVYVRGDNTLVKGNISSKNVLMGFRVEGTGNVLSTNQAILNTESGILVSGAASNTTIFRNSFLRTGPMAWSLRKEQRQLASSPIWPPRTAMTGSTSSAAAPPSPATLPTSMSITESWRIPASPTAAGTGPAATASATASM